MEGQKHSDCRNFVAVDVAKGLCRRSGDLIYIDTDTCENFQMLPKCKNCSCFNETGEGLGECGAEANHPWAYGEMVAVTCGMYAHERAK